MTGRGILAGLAACGAMFVATAPLAQTLYATSLRTFASGGSDKVVGNLYTINLATATGTLVAPIRMHGDTAVGITGLATHPATGVLYGITSAQSPVNPGSLVTIDPATGRAELVAPLGAPGSDIAFDNDGHLYVWLPGSRQLGEVDLATAAVRAIGPPGPSGTTGGIAIDDKGQAFVTPVGAVGQLDRVDTKTGVITPGPTLVGAPFPGGINAMTFSPSGLLLALNTNAGSPASVRLVAINTATGVVSAIGSLPDDSDGIAFAGNGPRSIGAALATISGRTLALLSLVLGLVIALAGVAAFKFFKR